MKVHPGVGALLTEKTEIGALIVFMDLQYVLLFDPFLVQFGQQK